MYTTTTKDDGHLELAVIEILELIMYHSHPSIENKMARKRYATVESSGVTPEWMQPKRRNALTALRALVERRNSR